MKSVLISIRPKWVEKIASGEKTIEVRKTRPKLETPFKCYIYCAIARKNGQPLLIYKDGTVCFGDYREAFNCNADGDVDCYIGEGKVIGEFICDWIKKIKPHYDIEIFVNQYIHEYPAILGENDCLSFNEMKNYLGNNIGYDWHISDLKIYDKPRELSEFNLTRPPQSWRYVEVDE